MAVQQRLGLDDVCHPLRPPVRHQKMQDKTDKQTATLREKMGCSDVSFRVVVQGGKVKLKAAPIT